jgi:hypothetical protein
VTTTRRTILSGALAAPFLVHLPGTASATTEKTWGTASDAWVEIRWSPNAYAQLARYSATLKPIAPATWVVDRGKRVGVRFPVRSGTGDPSLHDPRLARGTGELDGGLLIRTPTRQVEFAGVRPTLEHEVMSGMCTVNGVENSRQALLRCDSSRGRLLATPVPAGQPLPVRIENVPVYPTPETLEAITSALHTSPLRLDNGERIDLDAALPLGVDTIVGYATAEAVYHPPTA